jgi:hypothetical protein
MSNSFIQQISFYNTLVMRLLSHGLIILYLLLKIINLRNLLKIFLFES